MLKDEYLRIALREERYLERAWLLTVHGILPRTTSPTINAKVHIKTTNYILSVYHEDKWIEIEDYVEKEPLYPIFEPTILSAGSLKCVTGNLHTTYGLITLNALLIEYPYGGQVAYVNEKLSDSKVNAIACKVLNSPTAVVRDHHKFENAVSMLMCLSQTGVPAASKKSIIVNPEITKQKAGLLKAYEGRLHDASAVAALQNKLAALNDEYLKDDPAERFYIKKKSKTSLLKVTGMVGAEQDFIDESKINVMTRSLHEGWGVDNIQMMANAIRAGSYNRGTNTALGGYEVKIIARIFQNYSITLIDCNTKLGAFVKINKINVKNFNGRYLVDGTVLNEGILMDKIGQYIKIRSPGYCNTPGAAICTKCIGETITNTSIRIPALMTTAIANFLSLFLALVHGQALATERFDYRERIS